MASNKNKSRQNDRLNELVYTKTKPLDVELPDQLFRKMQATEHIGEKIQKQLLTAPLEVPNTS